MKWFTSILLLFGLLLTTQVNAQSYGNEWIDFSKTYYKVQSEETGIHRIPYSALVGTGLNLDASQLKLMHQGEQIPIYITTTGMMGPGDYVEFYGEKNDGKYDTQLFEQPGYQLQDKTSLFTKLASYFLVSDPVGPHLRFQDETTNLAGAPAAEDYFMYKSNVVTDNSFHFGEPFFTAGTFSYYSTFDQGEGWCSGIIKETINPSTGNNVGQDFKVPTNYLYAAAPEQATVNTTVVGRTKSTAVIWDQDMEISVGGTVYVDTVFQKFNIRRDEFTMPLDKIETVPDFTGIPQTRINFKAWNGFGPGGFPYETKFSAAEVSVTYPREFNFNGEESFYFELELGATKYIEIENFVGGSTPILYDLTTNKRIMPVVSGGLYQFKLDPSGATVHEFFFSNTDASVVTELTNVISREFTDYSQLANQGNYIIVTNEVLRQGGTDHVQALADYRESTDGGGHTVIIAEIDELYDQYAWGIEKHPLSIRHLCDQALDTWNTPPKHLFIIGKGVHYDKTRNNISNFDACLVPSFGFIPSDLMFVTDDPNSGSYAADIQSYYPRMAVGRIPVKEGNEIGIYLDKIITYESWFDLTDCSEIEQRACMRDVLHIAKGWGSNETTQFLNNVNVYEGIYDGPNLGFNVVDTIVDLSGPIPSNMSNSYNDNTDVVSEAINNGLSFINYVGHSAPTENYWQFDLQHPSAYENTEKYPFILSNSCFVGKINEPPTGVDYSVTKDVMAQDWVLYEEGGAIAFLAAVALSSPSFLHIFTTNFVSNLNDEHFGESLGCNVMYTIQDIYDPNDDGIRIVSNEFTFTGDPAIEMYHFDNPEYVVNASDVSVSPAGPVDPNVTSSIDVTVTVNNLGRVVDDNIEITINQYGPAGQIVGTVTETYPAPYNAETYTLSLPVSAASPGGIGSMEVLIDGTGVGNWTEDCTDNNLYSQTLEIIDGCEIDFNLSLNDPQDAYCVGDGSVSLLFTTNLGQTVTITQGSFTINGESANAFNTTILGAGTYTLGYTYFDANSGCAAATTQVVDIYETPVADFDVESITICTEEPILLEYTGASEDAILDWDFGLDAIPTLNADGSYTVEYITEGTKIISLTVESPGGCEDVAFAEIDVNESSAAPVLLECLPPLSDNLIQFNLDYSSAATVFYGVDGGPVENFTTYTPGVPTFFEVADANNYTLEIEIVGSNCGSATLFLSPSDCGVSCAPLDLGFAIPSNSFCSDETAVPTTVSIPGGDYSGPGINASGMFEPLFAGIGNHTLTYEYTENGCEYFETINVAVIEAPVSEIDGAVEFCVGESTELNGPDGYAIYSWTGPDGFTSDDQTITVTVAGVYDLVVGASADCTDNVSQLITEIIAPTISLANNPDAICIEDPILTLTASPAGGTFSGTGVTGTTFNPVVAGEGIYEITYTYAADDCVYTEVFDLEVNDACVVNCGPLDLGLVSTQTTFCEDGTDLTVDVLIPGGMYSGNGVDANGVFSPTTAGIGEHIITYTYMDENECEYTEDITLTVIAPPSAGIVGPPTICNDPITLVGSPGYADYLWMPGGFTTPNITVEEGGTYTLTVFDENFCDASTSVTITGAVLDLGLAQNPNALCLGSSTIQLQTNFAGGEWSGDADANGNFTPSTSGIFDVTYTYVDNGCEHEETISIEVGNALDASINGDNNICNGGTTTLSAPPGYDSYSWNNGQFNTQTISVATAGTYNLTVTDDGCVSESSIVVTAGDVLDSSISGANSICNGESTTLSGPAGYDSYSWNNGQFMTQTITVSDPGTYTLTVTNAGCVSEESSTVVSVGSILSPLITGENTICEGGSTTLSGPAGYDSYSWNGGQFNTQTITVSEGTYTLTVTDNGCPAENSTVVTIDDNFFLDATITGEDNICDGGSTTLSGPAGYDSYSWNNGQFNTQTISVSQAGTYNLAVFTDNGCSTGNSVVVTVGADIPLGLVANNPTALCQGDSPIVLSVNETGGTFTGGTTTGTFDPVNTGTYPVTYTYTENGCVYNETINLSVSPAPNANVNGDPSICGDTPAALTAQGVNDSYSWTDAAGNVVGTNQSISIADAGTYTLSVALGGCTSSSTINVTDNGTVELGLANNPNSYCAVAEPYQLEVAVPGGTFSGVGVNSDGLFSPASSGVGEFDILYTYSADGCVYTETIALEVTEALSAAIDATGTNGTVSCDGAPVTLSANTLGYDGYLWTNSNGDQLGTEETYTANESGTYFLSVTNGLCSQENSVAVTINIPPVINLAQNETEVCLGTAPYALMVDTEGGSFSGSGVNANGLFTPNVVGEGATTITYTKFESGCPPYTETITINVTAAPSAAVSGETLTCQGEATTLSATPGYDTYSWINAAGDEVGTTESLSVSESGTYTLSVSNNGCEATAQPTTVSINQAPAINLANNTSSFCMSDNAYQLITATNGGTYTGGGVSVTGTFSPSVAGVGTHPITYTYFENDCGPYIETINMTVLENPEADVDGQLFVCEGTTTTLNANPGYSTYSWTNAAGNVIGTTASITVTESGSIDLFVSNGSCVDEQTVTVSINEEPSVDWSANPSTFCQGGESYILTNDLPGGSFTMIPGVINTDGVFSPTAVGTYTVEYAYSEGDCSYMSEYTVEVLAEPTVAITDGGPICGTEGSTTLSATAGFTTYEWVNLQSGEILNGPTVAVATAGDWQLTATNAANCTKVETYNITQVGPFDLGLAQNPTLICDTVDYAFLVDVPNGNFNLNGGPFDGTIEANTFTPGTGYTLTYTYEENGCQFPETLEFEVVECNAACPPLSLGLATAQAAYCSDAGLIPIQVEIPGGTITGPAGVNSESMTIDPSVTGTGIITINYNYSLNDCPYNESITVEVYEGVAAYAITGNNNLCEGEETILSAPAGYNAYLWGAGQETQEIVVTQSGDYTVTVYNDNCTRTETISVNVSAAPTASISGDLTICEGTTGVLTAPEGYTYVWSTEQTDQSISFVEAGEYSVIVSAGNCSDEAIVNVAVLEQPIVEIQSSTTSVCEGETVTLNASVGNFENGTYTWTNEDGIILSNNPSIDVAPTSNQEYFVTFASNEGCSEAESIAIDIATDALPIAAFTVPSANVCVGSSVSLLNESINANGNIWTITNQETGVETTSNLVNPSFELEEGIYNVFLEIEGCGTSTADLLTEEAIIVSAAPSFDASTALASICAGEEITLAASEGDLTYTWEGDGLDTENGTIVTATPTEVGEVVYTVTGIATGNNCPTVQTVMVEVVESPTVNIELSTETYCEGQEITLTADSNVDGFEWTGENIDDPTAQEITVIATADLIYEVTVNNGNCTNLATLELNPIASPEFEINASALAVCVGSEVTLDTDLPNAEYIWTTNGSEETGSSLALTLTETTTVTATLNAGQDCSAEEMIVIEVYPDYEVTVGSDSDNICSGGEVQLNADGAMTYDWSNPELLDDPNGATPTATLTETTTFVLTTTNENDCQQQTEYTIEVVPNQEVTISTASGNNACIGQATELSIDGGSAFNWSNGTTLNDSTLQNPTATISETTDYVVTFVNDGGCVQSANYTLEVNPDLLTEANITADGVGCGQEEITLSIEGGEDFEWLNPALVDNPENATTTATISETTVFEANVIDINGCNKVVSYTANFAGIPELSIGGDTLVCSGDAVDLSVTYDTDYTYNWTTNTMVLSETASSNTTATVEETLTFEVEVEFGDCIETLDITINVDDTQEECIEELEIPNTMTPNGDNINDTWQMKGIGETYPDHRIIIYNRWGQKLLEFEDYAGDWDGTMNDGDELPEGTYYYVIELRGNGNIAQKGTITILR